MGRDGVQVNSLTVGIPALNEERNIEQAVLSVLGAAARVPELKVEVVVVDDGSTDRTADLVRELTKEYGNVRLIQNETNLGLGASIRRAIDAANTERFLFIPGDNDIPRSTLELLLRYAYAAEVVMCYFINDECRGRRRYLLSGLFKLIYTVSFGLYVQYINGPAVYPIERLRKLQLHSTRFSIVAEINVKLLRQGMTFVEVPSNRQVGLDGSTSSSLRNLVETVRVYLKVLYDVYVRQPAQYARRPIRVPYEIPMTSFVTVPRAEQDGD